MISKGPPRWGNDKQFWWFKVDISIDIEKKKSHLCFIVRQHMAIPRFDFDIFVTSVSVAKICHSRIHIISEDKVCVAWEYISN